MLLILGVAVLTAGAVGILMYSAYDMGFGAGLAEGYKLMAEEYRKKEERNNDGQGNMY